MRSLSKLLNCIIRYIEPKFPVISCIVYCNFSINRSKMDVVNINQFWFCCCACAPLEPALKSYYFRLEIKKWRPSLFLVSKYQWGPGNRLHRSDQSGEVSSTKEQLFTKRRESVKLKESEESAKPKQMCHRQTL